MTRSFKKKNRKRVEKRIKKPKKDYSQTKTKYEEHIHALYISLHFNPVKLSGQHLLQSLG